MKLSIFPTMKSIESSVWEEAFGTSYPFLQQKFLQGLESTNCVGPRSGWEPSHIGISLHGQLCGLLPAFLKNHSYGEYVFDWSWADAWQRSGLNYYPKLVTAAPFTPATGPRLWTRPDSALSLSDCVFTVQNWCQLQELSSWHILFCDESTATQCEKLGFSKRLTTQFHWYNRNYRDFDDFLSTFSSRKRKNLRRERQQINQQGLTLRTLTGDEIKNEHWAFFHRCYQTTYAKRSGHSGYLTREFFTETCPKLKDHTVLIIASHKEQPIAAALYFRDNDTLYGRYWGCIKEFHMLHFEACYYQGIEFCIKQGLSRFDPGAQGEHKIQRGFEPTLCFSSHWIRDKRLAHAVAQFCTQESQQVRAYKTEAERLLPFRAKTDT